MDFNIKNELKNIILSCSALNKSYSVIHPNTKYSLDLIIDEILYIVFHFLIYLS